MSPGEDRLLEFIASRIESMLRRPEVWGSLLSIEECLLQLLELRRVLIVPSSSANDTRRLMRTYTQFISQNLEDATPEPLSIQLERQGRSSEFAELMTRFADSDLATYVDKRIHDESASLEPPGDIETARRIIEYLRLEAEAHVRRPKSATTKPFTFKSGPN